MRMWGSHAVQFREPSYVCYYVISVLDLSYLRRQEYLLTSHVDLQTKYIRKQLHILSDHLGFSVINIAG